jgi:hypothetical protein
MNAWDSRLPKGSHLSIALDCWTSPFSQAFMAITGYFLDVILGDAQTQEEPRSNSILDQENIQLLP